MIYVIGKTGLVGSALCRHFEEQGIEHVGINRRNYDQYAGTETDILINANGSGKKGAASADPKGDFEKNVKSTVNYVFDFKYKTFIHVSSIDVYSQPESLAATREDAVIDPGRLIPYGFHKYLAERIVERYCKQWLILRLGGLVGPGLKKNPVYDWTHNRPFFIKADSRLTFIHTMSVAAIVSELIKCKVIGEIFNVSATDSIRLKDFGALRDFPVREATDEGELSLQHYRINVEKLGRIFPLETSRKYIERYIEEDLNVETLVQ